MTTLIVMLGALTIVLWALVKLREVRDKAARGDLPSDETTVMLTLFYAISQACLDYYNDKKHYPTVVSGAPDGLVEQ
mgnify:CR=1 FL=1